MMTDLTTTSFMELQIGAFLDKNIFENYFQSKDKSWSWRGSHLSNSMLNISQVIYF